jgi:hypothetical protein
MFGVGLWGARACCGGDPRLTSGAPQTRCARARLVPSAQISYTDGWLMPHLSGLNVIDLRLYAPVEVVEHVHITPFIGGIIPLEAIEEAQDEQLIGGVPVSLTF